MIVWQILTMLVHGTTKNSMSQWIAWGMGCIVAENEIMRHLSSHYGI